MDIVSEIKQSYKHGNMLTKLIYANVFVFLFVKIVEVVSFISQSDILNPLMAQLSLPSRLVDLPLHFWTPFTYMFLHQGFLHVLFNLLWLYWIGLIFVDFLNDKRFLAVYIIGGLSGAALYLIAFNTIPVFQQSAGYLLGASASVMAIVFGITMYVPDYTLYLVLIGPVKLKWLALVLIIIDVIMLTDGNPGGHIAHLGGALYGIYWGYRLKQGKDITKWLTGGSLSKLFKPKSKVKLHYSSNMNTSVSNAQSTSVDQKAVDSILDKIAKSGYESLSSTEKEQLFRASNKK
jgi:membrane associated rhomboid family serine protease